jgi:integrase/recombinase XerD
MSDCYSREELIVKPLPAEISEGIRQAIEEYTRSLVARNYSTKTIPLRRGHLAEFGLWLSHRGIIHLEDVTMHLLGEYQYWLHTHRRANGTLRAKSTQSQRLTALRVFFGFLWRSGRIVTNPALGLELPREEKPLPKPVFTAAEVEMILAQPDLTTLLGIRDRAILETLFATGIRRNELVHLTIDDIDRKNLTLRVRRGKGKRGRIVPISERALSWIDRYLEVRPIAIDDEDQQVLFLTTRQRQACGSMNITKSVRGYVEAAGIGKTGSCHMFRATTATMMLESGADIRFVQEMLGHAKITTTQIYTRVSISALQRVYAQTHPSAKPHNPLAAL